MTRSSHDAPPSSKPLAKLHRPAKAEINELPRFAGLTLKAIHLVDSLAQLKRAEQALQDIKVVGFDTESKPTFRKGEKSQGPHLIQLATTDASGASQAWLIPTYFQPGLELALNILSNNSIRKIGFGLNDDRTLFRRKFNIEVENCFDLARELVKISDQKQQIGARAAVAMVLGQRLSKGAQRSNWAANPLSDAQLLYAANDAYSALLIYQHSLSQGFWG